MKLNQCTLVKTSRKETTKKLENFVYNSHRLLLHPNRRESPFFLLSVSSPFAEHLTTGIFKDCSRRRPQRSVVFFFVCQHCQSRFCEKREGPCTVILTSSFYHSGMSFSLAEKDLQKMQICVQIVYCAHVMYRSFSFFSLLLQ